jgi:DNA mismatch repair protein MutS
VAKLAGLPKPVIQRARSILTQLEEADINNIKVKKTDKTETDKHPELHQLTFFNNSPSEIEMELQSIDVLSLTPIEAINLLYRLTQKAKGIEGVKVIR